MRELIHMPTRALVLSALLIVAVAVPAAPAAASPTQATIVQDDPQLIYAGSSTRTKRLNESQSLGAEIVKVRVNWRYLAPKRRPSGFDGANPALHVEQRPVSTIAPQALFLMNAPFLLEQARALAVRSNGAGTMEDRIDRLYRLAFGRLPSDEERTIGCAFVESAPPDVSGSKALSPLELFAQALLLSNEFVFVD